jgi:CRP/FNR family transcriptional regulator
VGRAPSVRPRAVVGQSAIDAALAKSVFAHLPPDTQRALLHGARRVPLASKEYFVHADDTPRIGLIVKGFVRLVRAHPDGRELTVLWEYPGCILGLSTLARPPAPAGIQAVTSTTFLELSRPALHELALTDPKVAWAITGLVSSFLRRAIDEIVIFALGDLRSRVQWRILELACRNPPGTPLIAQITQDELAAAVGAARPSVARVLKTLRDAGTIRSLYGGILVVKPQALAPPPHHHQVA